MASQLRQCSGSAAREGDEEVLAVSTPFAHLHLQTLQRFFFFRGVLDFTTQSLKVHIVGKGRLV